MSVVESRVLASQQASLPASNARRHWRRVLTHTHTYSGRPDHGGTVAPPEAYRRLVQWAQSHGVDAIGMGSPYTPATAAMQHRYDGAERAAYYGGAVEPEALRQLDEVERMLGELHRLADDRCLFYLDNETPKGRFGHLWWIGYHPDLPPWHDYDQPFDRWMTHDAQPGDDGDEPMPYERRPYAQIMAIQRAHGALGIWAHPTSWWRDDAGRFITNLATEMPAHAAAEGGLDGMVVMGYQPCRPAYQALWFALLDRGYRVPAAAEMDCGLSDPATWDHAPLLLNHVELGDQPLNVAAIASAFREGRVGVSSGPEVQLKVDGHGMGQVVPTGPERTHAVEIVVQPAQPGEPLARVELVGRGGQVIWHANDFAGGAARITVAGLRERGYLVARVFGAGRPGGADPRTVEQFALTSPVYLHSRGQGFARPVTTTVHVRPSPGSRFEGAALRFEDAHGTLLEHGTLGADGARATLPGTGRVTLVTGVGETLTRYLINANPRLQALQRYLYRGRFLRDFPDRELGDVPPEAWRLDEFPEAMAQLTLEV